VTAVVPVFILNRAVGIHSGRISFNLKLRDQFAVAAYMDEALGVRPRYCGCS
jgi:hypothetical protein